MFSPEQQKELEKSFNDFICRPQNAELVQKAHHEEAKNAIKRQEAQQLAEFIERAKSYGPEVTQALEPFMRIPVLRRVVISLGNDPHQDLAQWACNGQVQALLHASATALKEGTITGKELEFRLLQQLKAPSNPGNKQFLEASRPVIMLPADQLVSALNEHLTERRQGKMAMARGKYDEAIHHYQRALAIVKVVRGTNTDDCQEIKQNTVATLVQLAEAQLSCQEYGAAVASATEAVALDGHCCPALVVRATARAWRREYKAALADARLAAITDPDSHEGDLEEIEQLMNRLKHADRTADSQLFKKMLGR